MSTTAVLFISLAILLFLNVPIAYALGLPAVICMILEGLPLDMFPQLIYSSINKFLLLAIPFFVLSGSIMEKAGISSRLIDFANKCLGHVRGGLAIVCVLCSCFFAAISGSGAATVAALGGILIPAMDKDGYGKAFPSALMAVAGAIGIIIPPSVPLVVYGSISGVSVTKLFSGGMIPGIMMGLALIIASMIICSKNPNIVIHKKATAKERWTSFKEAFWGLLMPVIILGGIYGGIFTPTEAAVVACMYGFLVGVFIYRTIKPKDLVKTVTDAVVSSANIMMIIAGASLFAWFCTTSGISKAAQNLLLSVSGNKYMFLLIVNIILLIAGCFLEANAALYIFAPIMIPVAITLGYDPLALGVVMVVNMAIGLATPPVGVDLYVACGISHITIKDITKAVLPLVGVSVISLLLITYIPQLILFLPGQLK